MLLMLEVNAAGNSVKRNAGCDLSISGLLCGFDEDVSSCLGLYLLSVCSEKVKVLNDHAIVMVKQGWSAQDNAVL